MRASCSFRLDGARVLVIGAGRGLGRAAAFALADAGADVFAVARTAADLEEVSIRRLAAGSPIVPIRANITDAGDRTRVFETVDALDVLVNFAGTNIPGPFIDVTEAHLDRVLDLNVRTAFLVSQEAARRMLARRPGGVIIHVSSQMGHVGAANRSVYCMTKHALEGLTKAMAVELAPAGIRVNSIAPTFVETPMTRAFLLQPDFREWVLARVPLGRLGREEEVAAAVVFLASGAASLITGTSLRVDGGWTAQ